ncbi:MAG: C-type lectin-like protein [Hyphomicrobiales bacterium]|nr:C-type lectin-like protein [Hyphomicrobiales bacterium]
MPHAQSRILALAAAGLALGLAGAAHAQQAQTQYPNMTFFVSSAPGPDGANYGGLEGADKHCQDLAAKAGAGGKTWRAYLSQQAMDGKPAVNARDRIGKGPWANANGVQVAASVEALHDPDRNVINTDTGLSETGRKVPGRMFLVNYHDVLTGTMADGTAPPAGKDMTCGNWTKNGEGSAMVGHSDRLGLTDDAAARSWNAAHPSRGCSPPALRSSGGNGLLYCFAAN